MNWIEKIFRKKEQLSPEIKFDELAGWLDSGSEKISEELGSHAESMYKDIEKALGKIKKSASLLEKAEPEGRFHLKMVKVGTSNRDNMVKQVRMLIENISVPKTNDVKSIVLFHENAMQSLTVCLENMLKSHQYAKQVFLEESKQVIADVNVLGRLLNQLIEPVENRKTVLNAYEEAKKNLQIIENSFSDIEVEKNTIKKNSENIAALNQEIEKKQKALVMLKDSDAWKEYLKKQEELVLLENRARETESGINALILPLNKALNRLRQLSESGRYTLKPEVREMLYQCLADPKSACPEFFAEIKSIVESGALNIASEKKDKMLEQIMFAASSFSDLKEQYQTLALDIKNKKEEISNLDIIHEEKALNDVIKGLKDKLAAIEKELDASTKHLDALKQDVELKKQELQQNISLIDNKVRVLF
ncbi:MAG TPA: hypothetical protein VIO58_03775 [Candidatus Methanoperedens sp.]